MTFPSALPWGLHYVVYKWIYPWIYPIIKLQNKKLSKYCKHKDWRPVNIWGMRTLNTADIQTERFRVTSMICFNVKVEKQLMFKVHSSWQSLDNVTLFWDGARDPRRTRVLRQHIWGMSNDWANKFCITPGINPTGTSTLQYVLHYLLHLNMHDHRLQEDKDHV